jgi:hypothetical protein
MLSLAKCDLTPFKDPKIEKGPALLRSLVFRQVLIVGR